MLKNVLPVLIVTALVAAAYAQQPATPAAPAAQTPAPAKLLPKQPYTLGPAAIHEYPAAPTSSSPSRPPRRPCPRS